MALYREQFEFATARAVAPLNVLTEYCMPMVKMDGCFLAMKGDNFQEEIDGAKNAIFSWAAVCRKLRNINCPAVKSVVL